MIRRAVVAALLLLAVLAPLAGALTVNEVAREVRCPTCNTPLDVSTSPAAADMKEFIAVRIDRGWEKDRIIGALVDEFGPGVLATPPKSGFNLIAWLVPGLAVMLGLAAIPFITRAWSRRRPDGGGEEPPEPSAEEARRLDEELRRLGPM